MSTTSPSIAGGNVIWPFSNYIRLLLTPKQFQNGQYEFYFIQPWLALLEALLRLTLHTMANKQQNRIPTGGGGGEKIVKTLNTPPSFQIFFYDIDWKKRLPILYWPVRQCRWLSLTVLSLALHKHPFNCHNTITRQLSTEKRRNSSFRCF